MSELLNIKSQADVFTEPEPSSPYVFTPVKEDPIFSTAAAPEKTDPLDFIDLRGATAGALRDTFYGQAIMSAHAAIVDGDDFFNVRDPDFDPFAQANEDNLPKELLDALYVDIGASRNYTEYKRLINTAMQNKFLDDYSREMEVSRFLGSLVDVDLIAPFGVSKGVGILKGAARGAAIGGVSGSVTEAARLELEPGRDPEGSALSLTAPIIASSVFGGLIGGRRGNQLADKVLKQSGRLSDQPPRSDEIIKESEETLDILRQEAKANGINIKESTEPTIDENGVIRSDTIGGATKLADDAFAPEENWLSSSLSKTEQMPYWVLTDNKLGGFLGRKFSQLAHELSGRIGYTKGGVTEAPIGYMWQQYRKPMNDTLRAMDEAYLEYRNKPIVRSGATSMLMGNLKDNALNFYSRLRNKEAAVPFTNDDYHRWIPWALSYKNLDEKVEGAAEDVTLRNVFEKYGWGDAEWEVLQKGAERGKGFYEEFFQKLEELRLVGRESYIRRAEEASESARRRFRMSSRIYTEADKLDARPNYQKKLRDLARKQFLTALQLNIDELYFRRTAGDSSIEAVRLGSVLRDGLEFQRDFIRSLNEPKYNNLLKKIEENINNDFSNTQSVRQMLDIYDEITAKLSSDHVIKIKGRARNQKLDSDEWTFERFTNQARSILDDLETAVLKEDIGNFPSRNLNYFSHLYNPYKLDESELEVKALLKREFSANPYVNGKRLYTDDESLNARVDEAFENMRRRGAFQDSEGVIDGVEKAVSGFSPRQTMGRKLPLTTKQLLRDSPERSLIDTDYRNVINVYVNRVAPAVTVTEQFGDPSLYRKFDTLDMDLDQGVVDALIKGDIDEALRIETEGNRVWRSAENLRDLNLNSFGFTEDPTTLSARSLRAAKNFGIVNLMGRSGQMILGDAGRIFLAMRWKEIMDQLAVRWNEPKEYGLAAEEVALAGEVGETVVNSRAAAVSEYQGGLSSATRTESFFEKAVPITFVVNGMAPATDLLKRFTGVYTQSELIRMSKEIAEQTQKRLPFNEENVSRLAEFGIDKRTAIQIYKEWSENSDAIGPGNGTKHLFIAGTEQWQNVQVRNKFRAALNKEMQRIILTPGPEHKPIFMTKNLWSYLLQFRTFSMASTQEQLLPMLQRPTEKRLWRAAVGMLAGGFLVQQLRANPFDDDNYDKALRVIDYSGVIPLLMEPNNVLEIITMGNVGLRALGGGESLLREVTPLEAVGPLAGPAGSVGLNVLGALLDAEKPSDYAKALTQLTPLRTWYANFLPAVAKKTAEQFDE